MKTMRSLLAGLLLLIGITCLSGCTGLSGGGSAISVAASYQELPRIAYRPYSRPYPARGCYQTYNLPWWGPRYQCVPAYSSYQVGVSAVRGR